MGLGVYFGFKKRKEKSSKCERNSKSVRIEPGFDYLVMERERPVIQSEPFGVKIGSCSRWSWYLGLSRS